MSSLRRSTELGAARGRQDAVMRGAVAAGTWLLVVLLALPLLDLLRWAADGWTWTIFTATDSVTAGAAGMRGALEASALAMLPLLVAAIPLGLAVALYLEEINPTGRTSALVGGSIRHLAMLPPVLFGLLGFGGLVVVLGLPIGTPLLAGAVLGLAMLPRIVLAGQLALRQVAPAVRDAGFSMGASRMQVVVGHVLPRAAPAMLGAACSILARALGEAAPLLLVGFAAFAAGRSGSMTEPGVPLPVLVFRWGGLPDPMFASRAAAAALVLVIAVTLLGLVGYLLEKRGRAA